MVSQLIFRVKKRRNSIYQPNTLRLTSHYTLAREYFIMPKYKVDKKKKDSRRKDGPYDKESDRTWQKKRDEDDGDDHGNHHRRGGGDRGSHKHHRRGKGGDSKRGHRGRVGGNGDDTTPCSSFDEMNLKPDLLKGIYAYGFEKPSAIQQRAIRPIIRGRDVIAQSQSGTGKTAVFSIAALQLLQDSSRETQVLVLSPTRELAEQTQRVMQSLGDFMNVGVDDTIRM